MRNFRLLMVYTTTKFFIIVYVPGTMISAIMFCATVMVFFLFFYEHLFFIEAFDIHCRVTVQML